MRDKITTFFGPHAAVCMGAIGLVKSRMAVLLNTLNGE